jgi:hypothetical protein
VQGAANSQQRSIKEQLLGTWLLVSNTVTRSGATTEQFGANPIGVIIFGSDGHFALVNARSDLPKLASNSRDRTTPEEDKAIAQGSLAYYGTYTVSETDKVIAVHIAR